MSVGGKISNVILKSRSGLVVGSDRLRNIHDLGISRPRAMDVRPAQIGVEIRGVDLNGDISDELVDKFRADVHKHRLLIFKNQNTISEISKWFGELESTFYKHPKSPHPDVFRVSNNREEGCTNVGRTGWHIDGSFMEQPFGFSLYHMVSVPKTGDTAFVPLNDLIESLSSEMRCRWERLWMVPDRRDRTIHPLIYPHPATNLPTDEIGRYIHPATNLPVSRLPTCISNKLGYFNYTPFIQIQKNTDWSSKRGCENNTVGIHKTLCFHLGMTECFVWDYGTEQARATEWPETAKLLKEIHNEIVKDDRKLIYSHKWEVGDFIISDNLAVGHEASPETQHDPNSVGLRVLHRTTVRGTNKPTKDRNTHGR